MKKRYGQFNPKDYTASFIGIAILFLFAILSCILRLSFLFIIFPVLYAVIWVLSIYIPYRDEFIIDGKVITAISGKNSRKIVVPNDAIFIVSYADTCPPFATRTAIGNQTHILKNKYAVSILRDITKDETLKILHGTNVKKWTTSLIQNVFGEYVCLYSFVCEQNLPYELISNSTSILIIPAELLQNMSINTQNMNVYIDEL